MYSLHFTLKQHTPLIHFQHNQDRAIPRTNTVQSRLDKVCNRKMGRLANNHNLKPIQ